MIRSWAASGTFCASTTRSAMATRLRVPLQAPARQTVQQGCWRGRKHSRAKLVHWAIAAWMMEEAHRRFCRRAPPLWCEAQHGRLDLRRHAVACASGSSTTGFGGRGTWEDDGSTMVKSAPNSSEFTIHGKPGGNPVNALYSQPLAARQYFEIDVLASDHGASVGITTRASFAKGWKCRGLFFGGNLSNGGALVRSKFGDTPKTGMTIGVLTEITEESVTVTFYQDGRCLGPAFQSKRSTQAEIFPVVHSSGEGDRFAIRFPEVAPASTQRQAKDYSSLHPAERTWAVTRMRLGPELAELDWNALMKGQPLRVEVVSDSVGVFSFSFKVANSLWFTATSAADTSLAPFDRLTPSGAMASTKMMGPPHMMEMEKHLAMNCPSIFKWFVTDGRLVLTGQTIEMELAPMADDPPGLPATEVELI